MTGRGDDGTPADARPVAVLKAVAGDDAGVLLLGLEQLGDEAWQVLAASGVRLLRAADHLDAVGVLTDEAAQVAITDVGHARELVRSVRAEPELAAVYVVVCAGMDDDLRAALDAGADDVMRLPFEPEVVAARVVAGLRAARLRANEALLRSLVANITGAVYRCACDEDWTMLWLSGEIEEISGYRPSDFIGRPCPDVRQPDPPGRSCASRALRARWRCRKPAVHDRVPHRPGRRRRALGARARPGPGGR